MSTRRSNIRKRVRQRRRYEQPPQPQSQPKPPSATSGLLADLARPISSRALSEAIEELRLPTNN